MVNLRPLAEDVAPTTTTTELQMAPHRYAIPGAGGDALVRQPGPADSATARRIRSVLVEDMDSRGLDSPRRNVGGHRRYLPAPSLGQRTCSAKRRGTPLGDAVKSGQVTVLWPWAQGRTPQHCLPLH